ncbi:ATP-binding protein [Streptomyces sp. NPDC006422]|uniref:ATP-binding protein n=1 Tax=unclassified Streptomyces TaxID=2593676 RepID=UPI0033A7C513
MAEQEREGEPGVVRHADTVDYTPVARSVPIARRRTARLVTEWGHPGLAGDTALVVSELLTNALLHGSLRDRLIRVHLHATDTVLRVEVSDPRGERPPSPRAAEGTDQFGRGLSLVAALAGRWGWAPRSVGKTVYAEWDAAPVLVPAGGYFDRFAGGIGDAARDWGDVEEA